MKKLLLFFALIYSSLVSSCMGPNPEDVLTPEEKDVYVSNYDPEVDFSSYKTYTLPDYVYVITDPSDSGTKERKTIDVAILNAINEEMQKLGYMSVDSSQNPDLGLHVTKIALSYTGIDYSPIYYYDPYYGGGYYYPSYYVYEVRRGSVMIDMIDIKNPVQNDQLKVVWNGQFIDGLGTLSSDERIIKGVRSLFLQSTYLNGE